MTSFLCECGVSKRLVVHPGDLYIWIFTQYHPKNISFYTLVALFSIKKTVDGKITPFLAHKTIISSSCVQKDGSVVVSQLSVIGASPGTLYIDVLIRNTS
jgi:hypothetical protein